MGFLNELFGVKTTANDIKALGKAPHLKQNNFTDRYQGLASDIAGYANNGAQAQNAEQQQQLINQLQQRASGQGPSLTEGILRQALDRNAAQTNSLMASARGNVNPALLAAQAMSQNADLTQQAAGVGVLGRQQEQMNAQNMLGKVLQESRAQDIQNAGLYNQLGQNYENLGLGASQADLNAKLDNKRTNAGVASTNTQSQNQLTGNIASSLAAAGAKAAVGAAHGGQIEGQAQVSGDSNQNDTVPAMLSPGEIVIPRSHATDAEKAKSFIDHLMSNKSKAADKTGYAKVLEEQRKLKAEVSQLRKELKRK